MSPLMPAVSPVAVAVAVAVAAAPPPLPPRFACWWAPDGVRAARVRVRGELDIATVPRLAQTLHEAQTHAHLVVLDLSEVGFIDSASVPVILAARQRASDTGSRFVATHGRGPVATLFSLTGLDTTIDVVPPLRAGPRGPVS